MNPLSIIQLALGIGQTGAGIYGLTQANKLPPELQDLYNKIKKLSEEGLGGERSAMLSEGASGLARQATGAQARGSMALASRGVGNSSAADSMLADISSAQAQGYSDLVSRINRLDQEIKSNALGQLGGITGQMNATRVGQQQAAGSMLGGGLSLLTNPATYGVKSDSQKMIEQLIGQMGTKGEAPINNSSLPNMAELIQSVNSNGLTASGMRPPGFTPSSYNAQDPWGRLSPEVLQLLQLLQSMGN